MVGHIKLDRKIIEWEWYKKPNVSRLFIHLLLTANHKDGKWQGIPVMRGQVVIGRLELASDLAISEQNVRTALSKLKSTNEITIKSTKQYSIVTICKYDTYQSFKDKDNQHNNLQLTDELTINQPTTNQQLTTNNNDNNDNNEKKIIFSLYKPLPENFNGLPKIKMGAVIQLVKITKQVDLSENDVTGLWEVFKAQNLNGETPYKNEEAVYSHFINWSKNQKSNFQNNGKSTSNQRNTKTGTGKYQPKGTGGY